MLEKFDYNPAIPYMYVLCTYEFSFNSAYFFRGVLYRTLHSDITNSLQHKSSIMRFNRHDLHAHLFLHFDGTDL